MSVTKPVCIKCWRAHYPFDGACTLEEARKPALIEDVAVGPIAPAPVEERPQEPCRICKNCNYADFFDPRPDEEARGYKMGCKYPGWEGYTLPENTCEFFRSASL